MMRIIWVGEIISSNEMRIVELFMHNEFVYVVPTFLCCMEYVWVGVDVSS